jgi:lysophospholipase L1-like esterase
MLGPAPAAELCDPHCLSSEEMDALLAGAPWRRFVILGDSVAKGLFEQTPGYGKQNWGERIAAALRRQQPDLSYGNLARPDLRAAEVRETQLEPALAFQPDLASVVCGGNDLLVPEFDGEAVEDEIEAIVASLRRQGADVITFTMFDITRALEMPAEFGAQLSARLGELADRTQAVAERLDTIHVDLAREPICADPSIYASDYRHGSGRGQAVCASLTIQRLGEHLANRS